MTAIVGLFDAGTGDSAARARAALAAMHTRGKERVEVWHEGGIALGAVSDAWEVGSDTASAIRLASDERAVVATDATLYYLSDLTAALRASGNSATLRSPAELILAAFNSWGDRFLDRLEGDFALILWDRRVRRVIAARDHTGVRTLFYSQPEKGL